MRIKGLFQWVVCMGLLTAGLLLAGCAPDNTRLEFSYSPAPATMELEAGSPASVTVYEFGDDRQNQVYVGQAMADYSNPLVSAVHYQTARPIGQVVTDAIVRSLESQGFRVVRASGWNLDPATLRDITTELVVGGKVKAFWVEAAPYFSSESALVNIRVVIAEAAGKRILWEGDIVGSETFNTNTIEKAFSTKKPSPPELLQKAFSGAIDELSRHPDIQRALKSAMPQTIGLVMYF